MNFIKLQQDLIKAANNRDKKGKMFNGFYVKREFETIIGPNQSQAFIVSNEQLYIDVEKVFSGREAPTFERVLSKIESGENSNGFYLIYSWKNYSDTFSVQQVELSEQPFILLEDEKPNLLVLKIERVDNNNDWNT